MNRDDSSGSILIVKHIDIAIRTRINTSFADPKA
jgi:hypothetical protein